VKLHLFSKGEGGQLHEVDDFSTVILYDFVSDWQDF
jgi:hypothetical protein